MNNSYHTYIITRFSIYDTSRITTTLQSDEKYKEKLFDKQRLNFKFTVFEKITLPSINKQTNQNYTWLIYTSNELPDEYMEKLINLTKSNDKIKIICVNGFIDFFDNIRSKLKNKQKYFSMRLDDDDGLNINFLSNLDKYKKYNKYIISCPHGVNYTLDKKNNIIYGKKLYSKKIAAGIVANQMNIFDCGNHTEYDKKFKIIYSNIKFAYILCCSSLYCDSKRRFA